MVLLCPRFREVSSDLLRTAVPVLAADLVRTSTPALVLVPPLRQRLTPHPHAPLPPLTSAQARAGSSLLPPSRRTPALPTSLESSDRTTENSRPGFLRLLRNSKRRRTVVAETAS